MKKIILGAGLLFLSFFARSQGLENIVVEKFYVSNAADAAGSTGALPAGSVTYRIWADMLPGYNFQALYGLSTHTLQVTTTTSFFNNEDYGSTTPSISATNVRKNSALLDSYFSVGGAAAGKVGVFKSEDTDGSPGNAQSILQNNDPSATGPINIGNTANLGANDGMISGSPVSVTYVGISGAELAAIDGTSQAGNSVVTTNGSVAALGGATGPTAANRVLIGQFTTDGVLGFELNVQIGTPGGGTEQYVARNATGAEILFPGCLLEPNTPPVVSIDSPLNGANLVLNSAVPITATATDNGTVTSVQFFIDGTSIGTDNSAPYQATWASATPVGTHTITATATDNGGAQTSDSHIVNVVSNPPPVVNITSPVTGTTVIVPDVVPITATATDNGSVASVEFFVDGTTSLGVDNTSPYTANWTSTVGVHSLTAKATDNLGAVATSTVVTITGVNNVAPQVTLTVSPTSAFAPATFTLTSTASDVDGTVSSVEFFDGAASLGVDNTLPYSTVLTTTVIGAHSITAKATDNRGAQTTSSAVIATVLDASVAYNVGTIVATCIPTGFCIPVNALAAVSNVIGYDMVLHYDNTKVRPVLTAGTVVPDKSGSALINPAYVDFQTSLDSVLGNITISEFLNGAGGTPTFNGTGSLFCINFTKKAAFASVDTAEFTIPAGITESYYTSSTSGRVVSVGQYITYKDNLFNGKLDFWNGNGPLSYDGNPAHYLVTNIYGNNSQAYPAVCNANKSAAVVNPDVNGKFVYNTDNGTGIKIARDIIVSNVTPVINSQDALLTRQLLVDVLPSPSVYQVIAMDVNLDGKVTSGDVSQINQRNVEAIAEYKQVWTYDNSGNPVPGHGKSKDWSFVDSVKAASYGTFPSGYNKNNVPVIDTCIAVPVLDYVNCPYYANVPTYKGILIGDVDGNFATVGSGGTFKLTTNDKVIFDMSKAVVNGSYLDVPVSVASYDDVRAIDFALQFNESKLAFHSVIENSNSASMISLANYSKNDKTLRFATSSLENFEKNKALVTVRFSMLSSNANGADLTFGDAYLNGARVKTATVAPLNMDVNVYPNPANQTLYVESPEQAKVQLFDMQGREVIEGSVVNAYEKHAMDIQNIAGGVYMMKISSNSSVVTKKVLINK